MSVVAERTAPIYGHIPIKDERHKRLVLWCACLTSSLIMLDSNVVAVALPAIARDLHASLAGIQWVISAYLIAFASLLLPAGSFADLHGRRRAAMLGIALFLVSSAACGLTRSLLGLEIARAAQGIGGSLLLTAALAIITANFRGAERARAFAFWGTCLGVAMSAGPIAGGLITGVAGWRWVFLINVPICALLLVATRRVVPESGDPDARRLDVAGIVALAAALFALTSALIDGNAAGWTSATIVARLAFAAAGIAAFAGVEAVQRRPMLDLALFRNLRVLGSACGTFGYAAGAQVMIFFLPLELQGAFRLAPIAAGLAMLPFALPLFVAPRAVTTLLHGWSNRRALALGLGLAAAGDGALWLVAPAHAYVPLALAMLVAGIGAGILNPETAKSMQAEIPPERAGMASGVGATLRFVCLLLGVAILGAVLGRFGFPGVALSAAVAALLGLAGTLRFLPAR